MQKTPDEIKRGLEIAKTNCLYVEHCEVICPYNKNCDVSDPDAMTEIPREMVSDAHTYIQQLERERDALMEYIRGRCFTCRHNLRGINEEPCASCVWYKDRLGWEWRGVEEENHGEDR